MATAQTLNRVEYDSDLSRVTLYNDWNQPIHSYKVTDDFEALDWVYGFLTRHNCHYDGQVEFEIYNRDGVDYKGMSEYVRNVEWQSNWRDDLFISRKPAKRTTSFPMLPIELYRHELFDLLSNYIHNSITKHEAEYLTTQLNNMDKDTRHKLIRAAKDSVN